MASESELDREWSESESAESPTAAIAKQEQQERQKINYAKSKKVCYNVLVKKLSEERYGEGTKGCALGAHYEDLQGL